MTHLAPELQPDWTPNVDMARIIAHWTAGGHSPNNVDLQNYHVVVAGDGQLHRGRPSIAANAGRLKPGYAAHTLNCNTGSIGVAVCAMAGATESPFDAGRAPITPEQWEALCRLLAALATTYAIPVDARHVLTHAEVQDNLGIPQRAKWDIARLPFDDSLRGAAAVGDHMRAKVRDLQGGADELPIDEPLPEGARLVSIPNALNFRAEANGPIHRTIPKGTPLVLLQQKGDWLGVNLAENFSGWVHRDYVMLLDNAPPEEPTRPDSRRSVLEGVRSWAIGQEHTLTVAIALVALLAFASPANAQGFIDSTLTVAGDVAISILTAMAMAAVPWVSVWITRLAAKHMQLDADMMQNVVGDRLDKAARRAIEFAAVELRGKLRRSPPNYDAAEEEVLDTAAGYLERHVPETLRYFRLDRAGTKELLKARIPDSSIYGPDR